MKKEKLKLGTTKREVTKSSVEFGNAPKGACDLLGRYFGRFDKYFYCFSYNGGGKLVNYGLNTFVRDIYMIHEHVVYSDRFGRYKYIIDDKVAKIIYNSSLFITAEGVLLFYNKTTGDIYATLNCKVGYLFNVSSFANNGFDKEKFSIVDISTINKNTFIKVAGKDNKNTEYYLLNFSFNLYEAYSTQVMVNVKKVQDVHSSIEDLEQYSEYNEVSLPTFTKNSMTIKLCTSSDYFRLKYSAEEQFFDLYGLFNDNKEQIDHNYNLNIKKIDNDSEIGIFDCINSFVKKIVIAKPFIVTKKSLFKKESDIGFRNTITIQDRFKKLYTSTEISNSLYDIIFNLNIASLSLEGVIVIVGIFNYDNIHMIISLDGIMWKDYNISNIFANTFEELRNIAKDKVLTASLACKNDRDTFIISATDNNGDIINICEFVVDFTFNFWDLYNSPVEAYFTAIE